MVRGGEAGEHEGVIPDPVAGRPALLDPRLEGEAEGGEHGDEDQEDEARAKTGEGKARHPFIQCRPVHVEIAGTHSPFEEAWTYAWARSTPE